MADDCEGRRGPNSSDFYKKKCFCASNIHGGCSGNHVSGHEFKPQPHVSLSFFFLMKNKSLINGHGLPVISNQKGEQLVSLALSTCLLY